MDISILNIVTWIWKLTFQFWKLVFKFKNFIWSKVWYLNTKLLFLNLKISISILKNLFSLKIDILILNIFIWTSNLIFEPWSFKFKFEDIIWLESWNLNSKLLFCVLEINISIQKFIKWVLKWKFKFWILLFE